MTVELDDKEREIKLTAARLRLEGVARKLAALFGPDEACRLLAGALLGVAVGSAGRVAAVEFLEGLASALRADHPENWEVGED